MTAPASPQPRCPECCTHGVPLTRDCGACEDHENGYLDWINDDEPQWLCPHGIGVAVGGFGAS